MSHLILLLRGFMLCAGGLVCALSVFNVGVALSLYADATSMVAHGGQYQLATLALLNIIGTLLLALWTLIVGLALAALGLWRMRWN